MEALTFVNILWALLGKSLTMLLELHAFKRHKNERFQAFFNRWFKHDLFQFIASLLMIFVLLAFASMLFEDVLQCHVHTDSRLYMIYAFFSGYATQPIWEQFVKLKNVFTKER